jgi:hypothetical protein
MRYPGRRLVYVGAYQMMAAMALQREALMAENAELRRELARRQAEDAEIDALKEWRDATRERQRLQAACLEDYRAKTIRRLWATTQLADGEWLQ